MRSILKAVLLAAFLAAAPPGRGEIPDLSTPEKAYRVFFDVDQRYQEEVRAFVLVRAREMHLELLRPLAAERFLEKRSHELGEAKRQLDDWRPGWDVLFDRLDRPGKDLAIQYLRRVHVRTFLDPGPKVRRVRTERAEQVSYAWEDGGWRIQLRALACIACAGRRAAGADPGPCSECEGSGFVPERFGEIPTFPLPPGPPPELAEEVDLSTPDSAAQEYAVRSRVVFWNVMAGYAGLIEKALLEYGLLYAVERRREMESRWESVRNGGREAYKSIEISIDRSEAFEHLVLVHVHAKRPGSDGKPEEERLRLTLERLAGEWRVAEERTACDRCRGTGVCERCSLDAVGDPNEPAPSESCLFCAGTKRCRTCRGEGYVNP